jgi:inorganic pyrophosphatase
MSVRPRTNSEQHSKGQEKMFELMGLLFKPHPWHGVTIGDRSPQVVQTYVECVPGDGIKFEVDKSTGFLMVDRPHKFSSLCPTVYGFLPQTYCGKHVAERCMERTGKTDIVGDGDPIDICVLSTRAVTHGDCLLKARPIGGLRMIDGGEADDKIISIIEGDAVMSEWNDISDMTPAVLDLIRHYFFTYKQSPDSTKSVVEIAETYGREEAYEMIKRSSMDYNEKFSSLKQDFSSAVFNQLKLDLAKSLINSSQ